MPNNKYIINESQLVDIADAIRDKRGEQDTYTVDEMPGKIENIPSIPMCTVTFINHDTNGQDFNYSYSDLNIIDNGVLNFGVSVPYNTSVTTKIIYSISPWTSAIYICSISSLGETNVSNTVNCTVTQGSIIPTDSTKNSSVTIEILSSQIPK